jgi:hypothetical protein
MVKGLKKFREHFKDYIGSYVIIGGSACDIAIDAAGLKPRATKDIDIILIVEALSPEFVNEFWKFIQAGRYEIKERGDPERKYYRFTKPERDDFPYQIELFSRNPDLLDLKNGTHLTPIPFSNGAPSLSAILLDNDYYNYTIDHSRSEAELHIANTEALICLKAKAFLDLSQRKGYGENVSDKEIRKHKYDVFRLTALLSPDNKFMLPDGVKIDLQRFTDLIKEDLPDNSIFKEMGLESIDSKSLFQQFIINFNIPVND